MPKCEIYENGGAFLKDEKGARGLVYCTIPRGKCPYKQEGHRIKPHDDPKERIFTICKSNGLVGKINEKDKVEINRALNQVYFPNRQT